MNSGSCEGTLEKHLIHHISSLGATIFSFPDGDRAYHEDLVPVIFFELYVGGYRNLC